MNEHILIETLDGGRFRFDKKNIINFSLFEDKISLENMMEDNVLKVELENRTIYFQSKNIVKIDMVKQCS